MNYPQAHTQFLLHTFQLSQCVWLHQFHPVKTLGEELMHWYIKLDIITSTSKSTTAAPRIVQVKMITKPDYTFLQLKEAIN